MPNQNELCECGHSLLEHRRPDGRGNFSCSGQKSKDASGAVTNQLILCDCKRFRPKKDTYDFQRARIIRIVEELAPGKKVVFDEENTLIRFRIRDEGSGIDLTQPSGEWIPSVLADKSDDWLRSFVKQFSNGKIG